MLVQRHDVLVARKGADQHHQRAFGQVEVGDQHVHHLEFKTWGDEDIGVAAGLARLGPGLQAAHAGGAHGHYFAAARFALGMACRVASGMA